MPDEVADEEAGVGGDADKDASEQGEGAATPIEASVQQDILAAMSQEGGEAEGGKGDAPPAAEKSEGRQGDATPAAEKSEGE